MFKSTKSIRVLVLTAIALAPLSAAAAGVASLWPATTAGVPAPQIPGIPRDVRENLENFDDLDFRVYSGQLWDAVHLSHSDDIVVHLPDGTSTTGLAPHIQTMKWMFSFAPDTHISRHPVRFGSNDAEWTAVTSVLEGTFTKPMTDEKGKITQPTGNTFSLQMVTLGHWNSDGLMTEEYLFWDNAELFRQLLQPPQ